MTGVIDIGLQSEGSDGAGTFAMGRINADFHCLGTNEDDSDRFRMSANGAAKNGAPMRKNQAGMLSSPVVVGRRARASRILNILITLTCVNASRFLIAHAAFGSWRLIAGIS